LTCPWGGIYAGSGPKGAIFTFGYPQQGLLFSSRLRASERPKVVYDSLSWDASLPGSTAVAVRMRTLSDSLGHSPPWEECPALKNGQSLRDVSSVKLGDRFADYLIILATENPWLTPKFEEIRIWYHLDTLAFNPDSVWSLTHTIGETSKDSIIEMMWLSAVDESGIKGYSFIFDEDPSTLPAPLIATADTTCTDTLGEGTWWFHIRACDNLDNWAKDAVHSGPYPISFFQDTLGPQFEFRFASDTVLIGDTAEIWIIATELLDVAYEDSLLGVEITPPGAPVETCYAQRVDSLEYELRYATTGKRSGEVLLKVRAKDIAGNWGEGSDSLFLKVSDVRFLPQDSVYAYPNPCTGDEIMIRYYVNANAQMNLSIYTIDGYLVTREGMEGIGGSKENEFVIDVSRLPNEVYIFRLEAVSDETGERSVVTKKFAIVR
jgi:hypothetical protein